MNIKSVTFGAIIASILFNSPSYAQSKKTVSPVSFTEEIKGFARENKDRRKWDTPVTADLDQDGYPDLIINDHGYGIRIMWNNKGKFAQPYDLIIGDIHGVAVGDINGDGKLEVLVSRGGGSGSNARNTKIFRADKDRSFAVMPDFKPPLALMRGRTLKLVDLDNDGDLDLLNFAFPSQEKYGASENYIYENKNGLLTINNVLPAIKRNGQKTLLTDFNHDGFMDLLIYGYGALTAYQGQGGLTFKAVTDKILPGKINDVTGIVELDYDNDGDFDLFLTRGKSFKAGETFYNKQTKEWGFFNTRGKFDFTVNAGETLHIKNLQTQWPYGSFYLGETGYEYQYEGERHSGRSTDLISSDAFGFPDKLLKKGLYIGYIGNQQWRIAGDIFPQATGTFSHITQYPIEKHSNGLTDILLQNNKGKFTDVSNKVGLTYKSHSTGVAAADINNDGFTDLIISQRGRLVFDNKALVLLNEQGHRSTRKFEVLPQHGIVSTEVGAIGLGIDAIDYDLDGDEDIVLGNERGKWHLFENKGNTNNYITLKLPINKVNTLGALVSLKACGLTQLQRVGANGAAYSGSFNNLVHFGIGQCNQAAEYRITWSDGKISQVNKAKINAITLVK